MRVLFLASYFPKPTNPFMGTWALAQARALVRQGVELRTLSFTSWVPKLAGGLSQGARAFARCPPSHSWDSSLAVEYPRWLVYQAGMMRRLSQRHPHAPMALGWLTARRRLSEVVASWRPDVVYAHHSAVNGYLAHRLAGAENTPYVITDHSFGDITDCAGHPARERFLRPIVNDASRMISVSSRMEALVRGAFPGARTVTLHNGTDPVPADFLSRPRPAQLRDRVVVFSAAFFSERKGLPQLIEAFARVADRHPRAVLRIAGDGPQREAVRSAVGRAGLGDRIMLLGRLSHAHVLQEMAWSDVFALIGWDEPFGVVFSEAAACSLPILLASDCGFNDVFRDGVHGFSTPPRDPAAAAERLEALLADPDRRRAMGRAAFNLWVSRLTWDAHAAQLASILRAAIA